MRDATLVSINGLNFPNLYSLSLKLLYFHQNWIYRLIYIDTEHPYITTVLDLLLHGEGVGRSTMYVSVCALLRGDRVWVCTECFAKQKHCIYDIAADIRNSISFIFIFIFIFIFLFFNLISDFWIVLRSSQNITWINFDNRSLD